MSAGTGGGVPAGVGVPAGGGVPAAAASVAAASAQAPIEPNPEIAQALTYACV